MNPVPKNLRIEDRALLDFVKRQPCVAGVNCAGDMTPAHIHTRGSRAPDAEWNVMPLCMIHHIEQGKGGWRKFADKYFSVMQWLEGYGWYFTGINKLRRNHGDENA